MQYRRPAFTLSSDKLPSFTTEEAKKKETKWGENVIETRKLVRHPHIWNWEAGQVLSKVQAL